MQRKKKVCSECGEETYLYARKRCLPCDRKLSPEKHGLQTKPNKAPQGTNSSGKGKCTLIKRKSRISPVSKSMAKKLAEYRVVRDEYMREHPICEHPDCNHPATDLHHAAGRHGNNLIDVGKFRALCRDCHRWVEENPTAAKELGLSLNRL